MGDLISMGNLWVGLRDRVLESRAGRQISGSSLKARLIRGAGGTYALRVSNTGLKFLTSLVLARLLGADGFGVYNFAMAWLVLLTVPALFGVDRLLVRDLAIYHGRAAWGLMRGLLRFAGRMSLSVALVLSAATAGIAWLTYELTGRPALLSTKQGELALTALYTLLIALPMLPLWALMLVQQYAIQGLHHIVTGQTAEQIVRPGLFLAAISAAYVVGVRIGSPEPAMALQLVVTIIALVYGVSLLRHLTPPEVYQTSPVMTTRLWIASAIPLAMSQGLATLNQQADALMLGIMRGAGAVALFAVAQQGTQLLALLLVSANIALAPNIAHLHAAGRRHELQRTLTQSARLVLAGTLPLALAFLVGGHFYLSIFGAEFERAHTALNILVVAQLFNMATGSVGLLLMMTNHERSALAGIGAGTAVHVGLNMVLIPQQGIDGAAVAILASQVVNNLVQIGLAWHFVGIHTTVLGEIRLWKR
jgi:O-antigen/teichoic acid export membrane protein